MSQGNTGGPREDRDPHFFTHRLEEQSALRVCAFVQPQVNDAGIATGNLLTHNGELFIVTNEHVARAIPADANFVAVFRIARDGQVHFVKVPASNMKVVRATEDPDLALVRVSSLSLRAALPHLVPLTLQDIARDMHFPELLREAGDFVLFGFPREIVELRHPGVVIGKSLAFQAVLADEPATPDHLYLDWPARGTSAALPTPHGMSGSLIWSLPDPNAVPASELWRPGPAIAIQSGWRKDDRHIVCHRVCALHEWLA